MFVNYLNNLPYCLIGTIGSILVSSSFVKRSIKENILYKIIVIIIYSLLKCAIFSSELSILQFILAILILILGMKFIYDISLISSTILSIAIIIVLTISKCLISLTILNKITFIIEDVKINYLINTLSITLGYLLSKLKLLNWLFSPIIKRFAKKVIKGEMIFLISLISTIAFFNYQVYNNRYLDSCNICFILFLFMLIVFSLIYIINKNRYNKLEDSYNTLFEYACIYEEELERDKLLRHEHKNQLAVIKGLTDNEEVLNYIDQALENNKRKDEISIKGINNLPKGGLRGLFYYKISCIRKKNINFSLDVSKNVKRYLSMLSIEETKILTYIIGVFCDNAIDECLKDKDSNISIEIYKMGKEIKIIVSNTIINNIDIKRINEKGYTTKGYNHGNGLYLVNKLLHKTNKFTSESKIINNYFVQELKINVFEED